MLVSQKKGADTFGRMGPLMADSSNTQQQDSTSRSWQFCRHSGLLVRHETKFKIAKIASDHLYQYSHSKKPAWGVYPHPNKLRLFLQDRKAVAYIQGYSFQVCEIHVLAATPIPLCCRGVFNEVREEVSRANHVESSNSHLLLRFSAKTLNSRTFFNKIFVKQIFLLKENMGEWVISL